MKQRCDAVVHPLGPRVYRLTVRHLRWARPVAFGVFLASVAILVMAARITPDAAGIGSHRQLGLAPCSMVTLTGLPCPSCGMTTAFAHAVRGRFLSALLVQPAGMIFALATMAAAGISLSVLITGKVWAINWYRITPFMLSITVVAIVLAGWAFKLVTTLTTGTTFGSD